MTDATSIPFPVLLRTSDELAIVKPAGVAVELTSDPRTASVLEQIRRASSPGAKLPHRLDRPTRGVLLVALTDAAAATHGERVAAGAWRKLYVARVAPRPGVKPASLVGRQVVHLRRRGMRAEVVRAGGKRAELDVLAVAPAPDRPRELHALIELHTGRFHQIRATLAHLDSPLTGDEKYGGPPGTMYLEHAALLAAPAADDRPIWLHLARDPGRERIAPEVWRRLRDELNG